MQLNQLLVGLALDAINVQLLLDREFVESYENLAALHDPLRQAPAEIAAALAPRRYYTRHFEITLGLAVEQTRDTGFALGAVVLNAAYELRYGHAASQQSRIQLEIEQVPAPPMPE